MGTVIPDTWWAFMSTCPVSALDRHHPSEVRTQSDQFQIGKQSSNKGHTHLFLSFRAHRVTHHCLGFSVGISRKPQAVTLSAKAYRQPLFLMGTTWHYLLLHGTITEQNNWLGCARFREGDSIVSIPEAEYLQAHCNRCSLTTVGLERKSPSTSVTAHNDFAPIRHFLSKRMRVA